LKREAKKAEEQKRIDRERDPVTAAEEEARKNRVLFKPGASLQTINPLNYEFETLSRRRGCIW